VETEFKKNENQRPPTQSFNSKTIIEGNKYKVRELLHYMIAYSDNNATMLLHNYIDVGMFQKVFADLGIRVPEMRGSLFQMSVKEYSKFMRVLYDGGYLTIPASEYALSLLAQCDFNAGIVNLLPPTLKVAHKFGEAGSHELPELHESAIIYLDNMPYLLSVMTRGTDVKKQAQIISHISKIVYDKTTADQAEKNKILRSS
jgi:beta-lactamase class A